MKQTIERLREKPKDVRMQVAFMAALGVTGLVALGWGATLPLRLDALPTDGDKNVVFAPREERSLGSTFAGARDNLGQLIGALRSGEKPEPEGLSPSGAYTTEAPEEAKRAPYSMRRGSEAGVEPVGRRQVLIATSTRAKDE